MDFVKYITGNALSLIPALYVLEMIIKTTEKVSCKYIPTILLGIGIIGAVCIMGLNINAIIQGILATGAAVYANEFIEQNNKKK